MRKIIELVIERPKLVFSALLLITVFAIFQLSKLRVSTEVSGLVVAGDPAETFYKQSQEIFGSDDVTLIYVEDKELFTSDKLNALKKVTEELRTIDGVLDVNSLFTLKNFKSAGGGLEMDAFLARAPRDNAELTELRRDALRNPFARNVLSADGNAMLIYVHIRGGLSGTDAGSTLADEIDAAIEPIKKIVAFAAVERSFERVFQLGAPVIYKDLIQVLRDDRTWQIALVIGAILVVLVTSFRSAASVFLPLLIATLSALWVLGFMAATGVPVNRLTALLPALTVVLGSMYYVRMLFRYRASLEDSGDRREALLALAERLGVAFSLSFVAVFVGLLAVALNDVRALQQFGVTAALGLLFSFAITVTLTPLYLYAYGGPTDDDAEKNEQETGEEGGETPRDSFLVRLTDTYLQTMPVNTTAVLLIAAALLLFAAGGALRVQTDNDPYAYLDRRSSEVVARSAMVAERLHGARSFMIVFSANGDDAFKDPELLREVEKVQDYVEQIKLFDTTLSGVDLLRLVHRESNGGDDQYFRLPASAQTSAQYLSQLLSRDDLQPYLSADFRQAAIRVWHDMSTSYQLQPALQRLQEYIETLDKRLTVRFVGVDVLSGRAADSLPGGQLRALLALLAVVFVLISALFLSIKAGLSALLPNLIPAAVQFGVMGYLGIALTVETATVATMVVAISMTFTLYMMIRHNDEVREISSERMAMERTVRSETPVMVITAAALVLGFLVLTLAELKPTRQVGGLAALATAVALLVNLYISPKMIASMRFVTLWGMVNVNVGRSVIDHCELFRGMRPWQIKRIILLSQVRSVSAGEEFIRQGDVGEEMFVILKGQARVEKIAEDGARQALYQAHEGDVVGEVALVSEQERTASLVAETDMKMLVLEWSALEQLGRYLPMISAQLFLNVARIIGKRLTN